MPKLLQSHAGGFDCVCVYVGVGEDPLWLQKSYPPTFSILNSPSSAGFQFSLTCLCPDPPTDFHSALGRELVLPHRLGMTLQTLCVNEIRSPLNFNVRQQYVICAQCFIQPIMLILKTQCRLLFQFYQTTDPFEARRHACDRAHVSLCLWKAWDGFHVVFEIQRGARHTRGTLSLFLSGLSLQRSCQRATFRSLKIYLRQ